MDQELNLLTRGQVARRLGCSIRQVGRLAAIGVIPAACRLGPQLRRWRSMDIDEFVLNGCKPVSPAMSEEK